jgi:hypothetical protein
MLEPAVGGKLDPCRRTVRLRGRPGQRVRQSGDPEQYRDTRGCTRPIGTKDGATSSLSRKKISCRRPITTNHPSEMLTAIGSPICHPDDTPSRLRSTPARVAAPQPLYYEWQVDTGPDQIAEDARFQ